MDLRAYRFLTFIPTKHFPEVVFITKVCMHDLFIVVILISRISFNKIHLI